MSKCVACQLRSNVSIPKVWPPGNSTGRLRDTRNVSRSSMAIGMPFRSPVYYQYSTCYGSLKCKPLYKHLYQQVVYVNLATPLLFKNKGTQPWQVTFIIVISHLVENKLLDRNNHQSHLVVKQVIITWGSKKNNVTPTLPPRSKLARSQASVVGGWWQDIQSVSKNGSSCQTKMDVSKRLK